MSKRNRTPASGAMLDLWRPKQNAGDPVGCLATTYTFGPGLFDEQCLARFLDIESEPNREDLAFLLERESRLGGVYAGVMVDHVHAGVEHSLRWDVLPVRVKAGKQHAKLSLLSWSRHVRIIVASANLTEPGYRTNFEVAAVIDLTPEEANRELLADAVAFLRNLLLFVPGASLGVPEVKRASSFLNEVEHQCSEWKLINRRNTVQQQLAFTLPAIGDEVLASSSLETAVKSCRKKGVSPSVAKVASPFFDADQDTNRVTSSLCKLMARGQKRIVSFCVPAIRDDNASTSLRLAAPKSLIRTPLKYQSKVKIEILPDVDKEKNRRIWHAKMLALRSDKYSALMVGSSNFTCAGMGFGFARNAEANLITVVEEVDHGREVGNLESIWPEMDQVTDPESAEWVGAQADREEEEKVQPPTLPSGFLSATYRAGEDRQIVLWLDALQLPDDWRVDAQGLGQVELLSAALWRKNGSVPIVHLPWSPLQPPEKLLVRWEEHEAFLPLNVEDSSALPPPTQLEQMSADDMLWILAAADPSAAFRSWVRKSHYTSTNEDGLDSATTDLDPLKRYDLQTTFLHRIRYRARVLEQLRLNLQRPVWGRQALEWRLWGLIGIRAIAERMARDVEASENNIDEVLLTLADLLIVLRDTDYQPSKGSLSKAEFDEIFRKFMMDLAGDLKQRIGLMRKRLSDDVMSFWESVIKRCQE